MMPDRIEARQQGPVAPERPPCDWDIAGGLAICNRCGRIAGFDDGIGCPLEASSFGRAFWIIATILWALFLAACLAAAWFGFLNPEIGHG